MQANALKHTYSKVGIFVLIRRLYIQVASFYGYVNKIPAMIITSVLRTTGQHLQENPKHNGAPCPLDFGSIYVPTL